MLSMSIIPFYIRYCFEDWVKLGGYDRVAEGFQAAHAVWYAGR